MTQLSIVVAVAENGVIGSNGQLPWQLPDDLKRFKAITMGAPIVMGRRTHESIGRVLPGRRNLVVSSSASERGRDDAAGSAAVEWVSSLAEAVGRCSTESVLHVIGGAALYASAMPIADTIHLTRVHASPTGDVYFPALDAAQWRELERVEHPADARHAHDMSFVTLQRVRSVRALV